MQQIIPCLWFNQNVKEALDFYKSIFKKVEVEAITYYGPNSLLPEGSVMTAHFEIDGLRLMALNGGPKYGHTPAFSLSKPCDTQEEIDYYWEKLSTGGAPVACGWLTDPFGISWQIVPRQIEEWMASPDDAARQRMLQSLWQMVKLDIKKLQEAYLG